MLYIDVLVSNCHGAIYNVDFLAAGGVVSHNFFWSARAIMLGNGNLRSAGSVEGWRFISKDQSSLWHRVLSERRKKAWWMMGSATYRSLLPDMWRTFISCFFSGPFRTRNLGMPIRSEIKLCFVVGMCWKDFHINFQCMPTELSSEYMQCHSPRRSRSKSSWFYNTVSSVSKAEYWE